MKRHSRFNDFRNKNDDLIVQHSKPIRLDLTSNTMQSKIVSLKILEKFILKNNE